MIVPPAFDNETKQFVVEEPVVQSSAIDIPINEDPQDEVEEPIEKNGIVFAKTRFEGVLKTSYVRLKIVDIKNPIRTYELHIGEKIAAQPFSFNVRTVNPGYFYIELPAGQYKITSVSIPVGGTTATELINVTFEVNPDQISYLGTLRLVGTKERIKLGGVPVIKPGFEYEIAILNEFQEAIQAFKQRFPNIPGVITSRLMTVNR
ncbi:MAG: hypothetical protein AB7S78_07965 [Candidatus Omnitrophota bacterium]